MRVTVKLCGFSELRTAEMVKGKDKVEISFEGRTYEDLLHFLELRLGGQVKDKLGLFAIRNGSEWIRDPSCPLEEGDQVLFLQVLSGG